MSEEQQITGLISWADLTVTNAEETRNFYSQVVGWESDPVPMGGYDDFCMRPSLSSEPAAGICHAQGVNTGLPAQWLIYITVADLDQSMVTCRELGGEVIIGPKYMGSMGRYCVIKDPAGAVAALFEAKADHA